ncbi:hypothetical protein SAMN05216570_0051 [Dyella sp. OK004]|nr:hypothetical protein SAMN05216570_0051 [Dyella sp. OK004]
MSCRKGTGIHAGSPAGLIVQPSPLHRGPVHGSLRIALQRKERAAPSPLGEEGWGEGWVLAMALLRDGFAVAFYL